MSEWKLEDKPALILIHMQRSITDLEGSCAQFHAKQAWESGIVARQQDLLRAFREKGLPVAYVNSIAPPRMGDEMPRYGRFYGAIRKMAEAHINEPGTRDVDVLEAVANQPGEPVIGNWMFGMFSGNSGGSLKQFLDDSGVKTLVLAGVATGMAVVASVIQASDMFYNVIVPSDASIDANGVLHDVAMNNIIHDMALVTTTEDVIAHL